MSFTSDSILKHLDKSDYPLLNVNYDMAAVRVVGFCNQEKWAIIFELLTSYPSSDGIGLDIFAYGTGLKVEEGFATPVLHAPLEWRKMYERDESRAWMIYYALLNAQTNLLPHGTVCEGEVKAYFRVLNSELRVLHKQRIKLGIRFYVVVGSHKVAEGIVTEVLHLVDEN